MRAFMKLAAAGACLAFLAGTVSCAQKKQTIGSYDDVFVVYDQNKDGVITQDEFLAKFKDKEKAKKRFNLLDLEGKGAIQRNAAQNTPLNVWSDVELDDSTAQEP